MIWSRLQMIWSRLRMVWSRLQTIRRRHKIAGDRPRTNGEYSRVIRGRFIIMREGARVIWESAPRAGDRPLVVMEGARAVPPGISALKKGAAEYGTG
jgi:hypothetical protein